MDGDSWGLSENLQRSEYGPGSVKEQIASSTHRLQMPTPRVEASAWQERVGTVVAGASAGAGDLGPATRRGRRRGRARRGCSCRRCGLRLCGCCCCALRLLPLYVQQRALACAHESGNYTLSVIHRALHFHSCHTCQSWQPGLPSVYMQGHNACSLPRCNTFTRKVPEERPSSLGSRWLSSMHAHSQHLYTGL